MARCSTTSGRSRSSASDGRCYRIPPGEWSTRTAGKKINIANDGPRRRLDARTAVCTSRARFGLSAGSPIRTRSPVFTTASTCTSPRAPRNTRGRAGRCSARLKASRRLKISRRLKTSRWARRGSSRRSRPAAGGRSPASSPRRQQRTGTTPLWTLTPRTAGTKARGSPRSRASDGSTNPTTRKRAPPRATTP